MARHKRSNDMLTPGDVARLLNVHVNTVRRWSNRGILVTYRIGPRGDRRFRRADIDYFLAGPNTSRVNERTIGPTEDRPWIKVRMQ